MNSCSNEHFIKGELSLKKGNGIEEEKLYRTAELFKVFGDPSRLKILYELMSGELCVSDIAKRVEM